MFMGICNMRGATYAFESHDYTFFEIPHVIVQKTLPNGAYITFYKFEDGDVSRALLPESEVAKSEVLFNTGLRNDAAFDTYRPLSSSFRIDGIQYIISVPKVLAM